MNAPTPTVNWSDNTTAPHRANGRGHDTGGIAPMSDQNIKPWRGRNRFTTQPTTDRFWEKVDKSGTCWLWLGGKGRDGYGRFALSGGRMVAAHRFAYEAVVGEIPRGLQIDHLCRVTECVNPAHMEPVTAAENSRRRAACTPPKPQPTHCGQGHLLDDENTRWTAGRKTCRRCNAERSRRWRERGRV